MKIERPQFELMRVYADGTREAPEIVPVSRMPWDTKMERRGFLGVGVGTASVLLLVDGKMTAQNAGGQRQSDPSKDKNNEVPVKVPEKALNAHTGSVKALAISPNGKMLASGSFFDNTIKLWSLPEAKLQATLEGHKYGVEAIAISPDGKTLASGSFDDTIKLWSLPGGSLQATFGGYGVIAMAISQDGKTLASGSRNEIIELKSLPEGKLQATLRGHQRGVEAVTISPDGKTLASGSSAGDETIKLWALPDGKLQATLQGHQGTVYAVAISPDGKTLVSGSFDTTIKLWSLPEAKLQATLRGHQKGVNALAISSDGKTLASGSFDNTIKLWSLPEGNPQATLQGHQRGVNAITISPDGKIFASGDGDGVLILWNLEKRSFLTFLFDPKANQFDAIAYNVYDKITGQTITYTLPCGSPIPSGAVCTCNCVPGTYKPPSPAGGSGGGSTCICNKVCTCIPVPSDRNVKEAFETTDPLLILQRLSELPIQTWNYKWNDAAIRHIGPMAQDFAAAFAVGEDDKHICPVDAQGVALAAIQGLYRIVREKEAQTASLQAQLQCQQTENQTLHARVEALELLVKDVLGAREDACEADKQNESWSK